MTIHSRISGFGFHVPATSLSNADIESRCDITDEWILSRTGIATRRILGEGESGSDLALAASTAALENCGRKADEITHIVYTTCTPDACCPSAACTLAGKLGIDGLMAVDVNAACAGFVNGMELADALVARSPAACVLLVASECLSHRCNWEDRTTAVLFGDGAGAVLVTGSATPPPAAAPRNLSGEILDIIIGSDGSKGDLLLISGGFSASPYKLGDRVGPDYFIRMQGGLVFKQAVRCMTACCKELLERNSLGAKDVDLFIPHQANSRIIEAVGSRLDIPAERVFLNVHKYGNTSAASIPLALGEAMQEGRIERGMRVLVATFGGGLTWGAALMRF
ncbi:ketoacyl-ACP synthase III [Desulfovibrio sp. OttesenSCG-928-A18]|nr:ketoacyl-ACP synthase III [Desulfovibrio sp. OttesenSCG-928-A18]